MLKFGFPRCVQLVKFRLLRSSRSAKEVKFWLPMFLGGEIQRCPGEAWGGPR